MKKTVATKSSKILSDFLDRTGLHKKDFAQMIGVTLSYVYNLIDNTIPFSTRSTTLERIATVMEVEPETFEEYRLPQEPIIIDTSVETIKKALKTKKIRMIDFLKAFPRNKRLDVVDMMRGAIPVPVDYKELKFLGEAVGLDKTEIFDIWESRFRQVLNSSGMNIYSNLELVNEIINCTKNYIYKN